MDIFKLFGTIAINNSEANSALDGTSARGEAAEGRLTAAFKKIGAAVATYFTVSTIVNFGKQLVNLAGDAETAAAKVNTLLTEGTDTNAFFESMKKASTETGVAMTDFAEAVYSAISASVDQEKAVAFTQQAVMLAKAGFTETATAVDVLTTAINAYGLETSEATHLSDVLITTQNLGKTTVGELASSMGKVIPLASAYEVNIENLSAAYAVLTKGGIATAESTTYLKGMFTELADSGSDVAAILKDKTGKSFSELMKSGKSLGDVMDILMESVDGDTTAFANLWSSTEAGTGALALANAGAEEFNETLQKMFNSTEATRKAYETVSSTFQAKTAFMKVAAQNFAMSIGSHLLPALGGIVEKATAVFVSLEEKVNPAFEKAQEVIGFVKDKFAAAGDYLKNLFSPELETLRNGLGAAQDAFHWVADKAQIFIDKITTYVSSGQAAADFTAAFEGAVNLVRTAFEKAKSALDPFITLISNYVSSGQAAADFTAAFEGALNFVKTAFETAKSALEPFITLISNYVSSGQAAADFTAAYEGAVNLLKTAYDHVKEALEPVIEKATEFGNKIYEYVSSGQAATDAIELLKTAFNNVKTAAKAVSDWCVEHKSTIQDIAIVVASFAAAWQLVNVAVAVWKSISTAAALATGLLTSPITLAALAIGALIAVIALCITHWDEIKEKAAEAARIIAEKWEEAKAAIGEKITSIVSDVTAKFEEIKSNISTKLNSAKATVEEIFTAIKESITEKIEDAKNAVIEKTASIVGDVTSKFNEISTTISTKLSTAKQTVEDTFTAIKQSIEDKINTAKQTVSNAIEAIKGFFKFEWSFPHLNLPHLVYDLIEVPLIGTIPNPATLHVEWYKKGGVMMDPTLFGMNGMNPMIGGEAGPEAVAPIDVLQSYVADAVASQNAGIIEALHMILDAIITLDENMGGNLKQALDGTSLTVNKREFGRLVRGVD